MRFVTGTSAVLQPALFADMARYRHEVFVKKLGWQLQCQDGLEYDEFDRKDTVYVVAQDESGDLVGTARLLPTTRPYLLDKVFPNLWSGGELPNSPEIWEISRFAAVDLSVPSTRLTQISSEQAVELLRTTVKTAADLGAKKLVSASPLGVERLLRAAGFSAHRAGSCQVVNGYPIFACVIHVEPLPAGARQNKLNHYFFHE